MAILNRHICLVLTLSTILLPRGAVAQVVATSLEELQPLLKEGQRIAVTDTTGHKTIGRVTRLTPTSFGVISTRDTQTFGPGTLTARVKNDGLKEGLWLGALAGAASGAVLGGSICGSCQYGWAYAYPLPVTIPVGMAVGAFIDWAHKHKEIEVNYRGNRSSLVRN